MWGRLTVVILAGVIVSGCGTSIRQEVAQIEGGIAKSKGEISGAEAWLQKNRDVYNGASCVVPARGVLPKFSCQTMDEAKQKSLAACAISYKGCDVALSRENAKLDSDAKKFLASEVCERMVAEMLGEERNIGNTIVDGITAMTKSACDSDNILVKAIGCVYYGAFEVAKFVNFVDCADKKKNQCISNYNNWRDGPSLKKAECDAKITTISSERQRVVALNSELREKKDSFAWMLFGR